MENKMQQHEKSQPNERALHSAIKQDKLKDVKRLRQDVDDVTYVSTATLNLAAEHSADVLRHLLQDAGADVNGGAAKSSGEGATPLVTACRVGKLECVQVLLDNGADVNMCSMERKVLPQKHWPQHSNEYLVMNHTEHKDAMRARAIPLQHMMDASPHDSPLQHAIRLDRLDIASLLLQHGANVDYQNPQGNTALHLACASANSDIDNHGDLMRLIVPCRPSMVSLLLQHHARTTLSNAAGETCLESLLRLAEEKIEAASRKQLNGLNDNMHACWCTLCSVVMLLQAGCRLPSEYHLNHLWRLCVDYRVLAYDNKDDVWTYIHAILRLLCLSGSKLIVRNKNHVWHSNLGFFDEDQTLMGMSEYMHDHQDSLQELGQPGHLQDMCRVVIRQHMPDPASWYLQAAPAKITSFILLKEVDDVQWTDEII